MKTNLNAFFFMAVSLLSALTANAATRSLSGTEPDFYINMPVTGSDELDLSSSTVSKFKVYDDGGYVYKVNGVNHNTATNNYSHTYLVMTAPANHVFQVKGSVIAYAGIPAYLGLFDGTYSGTTPSADSHLYYLNASGQGTVDDVGVVRSSGNVMTIYFYAGATDLDLEVSMLDATVMHTASAVSAVGGSISSISPSSAGVSTPVTVKLAPSPGYLPLAISATSSDNTPVDINLSSSFDYTVSFMMPYGDVTIMPEFTGSLNASGGVFVNMPSSNDKTYTIPENVSSFNIYDAGGAANHISEDGDGLIVLKAPTGKIMKIYGTAVTNGYSGGGLTLYEGNATSSDPSTYSTISNTEFDDYLKDDYEINDVYSAKNVVSVQYVSYYSRYNDQDLNLTVELLDADVEHACEYPGGTVRADSVVYSEGSTEVGSVKGGLNNKTIGQTVTLTATPKSGYFLADLELVAYGKKLEYTRDDSSTDPGTVVEITFDMPYDDVTIIPHFAKYRAVGFNSDGSLNNYMYFHMECENGECVISQKQAVNPITDGNDPEKTQDFMYWYRGSLDSDDNDCEEYRLPNHSEIFHRNCKFGLMDIYREYYPGYSIKFVDSLRFGGYDSDAGKCAMQFKPFTGEDFYQNSSYDITITGKNAVIDGLCQMDESNNYPQKGIAYANYDAQEINVSGITLTNPYIDSNNSGPAGVVVGGSKGNVTISDVHVKNAVVKGPNRGEYMMGGLVGSVSGANVSIENSSFEGTVSGPMIVGGLVGSIMSSDNIDIRNSSFVGKVSGAIAGGIVGLASLSSSTNSSISVNECFVKASNPDVTVVSGSSTVGGIVGGMSSGYEYSTVSFYNTYSIGTIDGPVTNGYIIGSMSSIDNYRVYIQSNYHYGNDNLEIGVGGLYTDLADWLDVFVESGTPKSYNIYGNIRNAVDGFSFEGTLHVGPNLRSQSSKSNYRVKNGSDIYHNGAVAAERMSTKKFAAVLNGGYGSLWTFVPGENANLPFYADETYSSIKIIGFSTEYFTGSYSTEYEDALANGDIDDGYCGSGCGGFSLYTDYKGHLSEDDVKIVESMTSDGYYWYSSRGAISISRRYDSNVDGEFDVYQYKSNLSLNVVYHLCPGAYEQVSRSDPHACSVKELEINGEDLADYYVGFSTTPIKEFSYASDALVPLLIVYDGATGNYYALKSKYIRFNPNDESVDTVTYSSGNNYFSQFSAIGNDFVSLHSFGDGPSDFQKTLHVLYALEDKVNTIEVANVEGSLSYVPFVFNVDGGLESVPGITIASTTVGAPMTPGFKIESRRAGYSVQDFTVELGYTRGQNPITTVDGADNYFVTPDGFAKGYDGKSWKITGVSATDVVSLDSVYKGAIDENVDFGDLNVTITPTYKAIDYNVVFDIKGTDSIAINVPNYGSYKFSYDVYAPKDLTSLPTSYNLDARNKNLPMLYAVTQNSAGDKMYASVWTGDSEKSRCVMSESNCAASPNANSVLSSEQIEDAGDNIVVEEGKDPTLTLYPVWTAGTPNDPNYLIIDCDGDALCESGELFTLKLTQNVTIAGNEYELQHSSAYALSNNLAGPSIPLPQGVAGDFEFSVNFDVAPGYDVDTTQVVFEGTNATYENGKLTLNLNQSGNVLLKGWTYSLNEYTVSFDLDQLIDNGYKYVILGDNWTTSKKMDLSSENNLFPKVYVMGGSSHGYLNATWSPDSGSIYGIGGAYSLEARILEKVDSAAREFTVYPTLGDQTTAPTKILVETYDENGDLLTAASDYHGRVVLTQNADPENENNKWIFEQPSALCERQQNTPLTEGEDRDTVHCLYIPYHTVATEDVLAFEVSLKPDPGYAMELIGFDFKWRESSTDEPKDPPAGFGYNTENDTLVIQPYNMGMDTMLFKVKYTVTGPFYVKYDLNTLEEDEDKLFLPSKAKQLDTLVYSETVNSIQLWEPYRTDKCFVGWYDKGRTVTAGSGHSALKAFDADYAASTLETDVNYATEVYAIWEDCADGPNSAMTIANGSKKTNIKLKQTFGDKVYTHVLLANQKIALGSDTYLFTVDTVGSMEGISEKEGYLSATSVAAERDGITFSEPFAVPLEEMTLVAKPRMAEDQKISPKTIYTLSLLKDEYLFVYDKNTEANVFFMTEAIDISEKYISRGDEFITAEYMGRADACLDGWSLAADGVEKYTELNDELLKILDNEGYEEPVKLYAVWDESCDQEKFTISMSPEMEDFGKYKVYYVMKSQVYLPEDTIWFDVGKDGLEVPTLTRELGIKFVSTSVYNVDSIYGIDAATYEIDHDTLVRVADGEMFEIADGQKNLILYSPVQLLNRNFVLDVNAESNSVFFGTSFMELSVYAEEGGEIPMAVYRNGYKLAGWSLEKDPEQNSGYDFSADPSGVLGQITGGVAGNLVYAPKTHQIFNKTFEEDYVMYYLTYQRTADTLYAVWEKDDDPDVWYVVNKDPNKDAFTFRLTQEIGGEMFEHLVADSLAVPAVDGIEFRMEVLYDHNDFEIDGKSAIVVLNEKGNELDILENDSWIGLSENIGLKANVLRDKRVQLKFNENSKDSLFHGSDWIDEVDFDQDSAKSVELPTLAYNAEKCLAGWTTDTTSGKLFTILNDDLLSDLRAKSAERNVDIRALLYAKWTTNLDSCAGEFMKLAVEQENGTVWFAEADKKKTIERRFTDEGTMFVPRELDGSRLKVQASGVDTSVYVLDSLVVLRNDKVDTVLFVGDYMPEILDNVALKAYFGWKNKTEVAFVDSLLKSSGSVFKLSFKASDFEVRRRVAARVLVDDIGRDTTVIDTVLGDSIEMGYGRDFIFRMKRPGNYKMLVTLKDKADSIAEYTEEFSVSSEISSIAVDSWQMLSLAAVDMSTVKDDGDQIFYWWDEYGTGEFWQYKRLDPKDSVAPTLGVWYNSLEGRSLTLLSDAEDEGEDFTWKLDSANTGWNMVANPHSWTLDLYANHPDVKKNFDEESEISFWRYNAENAEPEPVDTIGPYEAVWAKVSKKTKWNVSADPFFTIEAAPLEKRALAKAVTRDRWTLQAILTDKNGKQDSWNILGAGLNPFTAEEPPESMGDHVNLSIVDGKRALAKSIKESDDEMEWTIALSASSNRVGYLSFAGIEGVNGFGYRVFVTIDGNTTEMQEGVPLTVFLKSTAQTATVRVAPTAKMLVQNTLKGLRMARLGNQLRVSFEASEGLAGTKARVDLMDMKGHVISTVNATAVSGTNALVLDTPQSGLYMLRVRAGSEQQATKVVVK